MNKNIENTLSQSENEKFKTKVLKAAVYVVSGNGVSKIFRLLSNLVLTRLLVPEFFGIIALARTLDTGIALFSDIGLGPGIIRSSRSNDPDFLNTAWTLAVIRGLILWPFSIILAFPAASFYQNPLLVYIIPAIALNFIIRGFTSTSLILHEKELNQKRLITFQLSIQLLNIIITIILAYIYRSVWSLIIGGLISELVKTIWSHFIGDYEKNKFRLEKTAVKELLTFGKWIFVSTAMMFLATQADKLLLGKFFPLTLLGVYYIAVVFADLPKKIIGSLSQQVLYPVFSKISDRPRNELKEIINKKRKSGIFFLSISVALFASFGDKLILSLYDQRYDQAAWMLPLLVIGIWPRVLTDSIDRILFAVGKPSYWAVGNFVKVLYMIIMVPLIYKIFGVFGAVVVVALNDVPLYIVVNFGLIKEKLSLLKQDLLATLLFFGTIFICVLIRILTGIGIPEIPV
ncbi:MAG: oligosaccharide flippase family protein [Spirochaetaceae bacterium]|nr:oligosaccharide flippase family protein [Spirochaetaceae bacterium]